ncbi:hypothetical protein GQ55_4G073600 [Panicum hallii var. hallii]|uniref:Uncharacterized protein n=1 Tax=Panicum hallii var. hallii TaxID=1504633 RepID=A0A2T7DW64_9POAL|nr:hypothetical protein GQ55_4G073600 [Panicum hallii var. hallii]
MDHALLPCEQEGTLPRTWRTATIATATSTRRFSRGRAASSSAAAARRVPTTTAPERSPYRCASRCRQCPRRRTARRRSSSPRPGPTTPARPPRYERTLSRARSIDLPACS